MGAPTLQHLERAIERPGGTNQSTPIKGIVSVEDINILGVDLMRLRTTPRA